MALIELRNPEFSYGATPIVGPLSIQFESGRIVAIMGPSGCGKSTLLRLISGLEKPTRGTCILDGVAIDRPSTLLRFSFQDFDAFPWRTVRQNLLLSGACEDGSESAFSVDDLLEKIGLTGHEKKYPAELSGGMRKRLALGRCLAGKPKVILLDEPFSSLDVDARQELYGVLQALWCEVQCLVIVITHDPHEAILLSHQVLVSTPLPFQIKGKVDIKFRHPRTEAISLEPEYMELSHRIRELLKTHDDVSLPSMSKP